MKFFDYLEEQLDSNFVVAYTGRFCPPHNGHVSVFRKLQKKFGANNVYIITSDKSNTSPFTFEQKSELFEMFGISKTFVKKMESSGYNAPAIMKAIGKPSSFGLIVAIGEKDKDRLRIDKLTKTGEPGFYKTYMGGTPEDDSTKSGYVFIIHNEMSSEKIINASEIREALKSDNYEAVKEYMPQGIFEKAKEMMNAIA